MKKVHMLLSLVCFLAFSSNSLCGQLNFVVIGDWGGATASNTTTTQLDVATAMGQVAANINSSFVVSVGDNFYDTGVSSVDDFRWQVTFENVYTAASLQTPWYIVAGNRDYYGNVTAELEYSKISTRWKFPSVNHDTVYPIPNSNATVHIIYFDSWDLTDESHNPPAGLPDPVKAQAALDFLQSKLASSTATWRFVVTHYPVYSAGAHGPSNAGLLSSVEPILQQHRPDAYFCGHDHSEQHLLVNGMNYFVVGGGSEVNNNNNGAASLCAGCLVFMYPSKSSANGGFAAVLVTENNATIQFWSSASPAKLQYDVTLKPQDRTAPAPSNPPPPTTSSPSTSGGSSTQAATFAYSRVLFLMIWVLLLILRPNH